MNANDRQVGGSHYASEYQHWDFVVDVNIPYLAAAILKYTSRHAAKDGERDLRKAEHFAEKLIEVFTSGRLAPPPSPTEFVAELCARFVKAQGLNATQGLIVALAVEWRNLDDLELLRDLVTILRTRCYPAKKGGEQ